MTDFVPAVAFPPGEFLKDELEERGWTQDEFARIIGRPARLVSEIVTARRGVTPDVAILISAALGTSAQFWMNLETSYRLYELSRTEAAPERVGREARLREKFPVREIVKRGWVKDDGDPEVLRGRILRFYGIKSEDDTPPLRYANAAKRGGGDLSPLQEAWLYRVKQIAEGTHVGRYSEHALREALEKLKLLRSAPEEARHLPRVLAECGVRFIIVEPMKGSKIDGVCLWLDDNQPVIGLSLRLDRIDNFWFVVRHEIEHVLRGDGKAVAIVDSELCDAPEGERDTAPEEVAANSVAADFCVSNSELENFIARVGAVVGEERIILFAERLGVHPGLVVGQLQWRWKRYNFLRSYLVKVRDIVVPVAMTDGYGRQLLEAVE